jgi:hypothetical protein
MANTSILTAFERMWHHVVAALSNKSDISHTHDDKYYTQTQIDTKLQTKAEEFHSHDDKYDEKGASSTAANTALESAKSYTDTKISNLVSSTTVDNKISTHNTSTSAHSDIRDLITGLTTRLNTLANSDDTTLDQMSEVVTYIKNNKSLIDGITTSKVNVSDIVNNLTTSTTNKPLSAAQGVAIKALIDALQDDVDAIPQADWNQNDSTKLDFIKNRPFYTTDPVETVIVNGTIPAGGMMQTTASINSLTLGELYTAVFDGVTYNNLVCKNYDGLPSIWNDSFMFAIQSGRAMAYASNSASHTLKVMANLPTIVPLDRKYIAEHIDAFAGQKVKGKEYTIDGSQVTAGDGAEVFNDYANNIASGRNSHAEGSSTTASGMLSHAEGWSTVASGSYTHAEGYESVASGDYSHAEGWDTEATNQGAHSEGFGTHATGRFSHAEGDNATAAGRASHAEGYSTEATADYSHAEGMRTIASSQYQHVQGKFNVVDSADKYAHIVGNGTSNSSRKNAHTIDWDGNAWFAGSVEATSIILKSSTSGSDKKFKITIDDTGTLTVSEIVGEVE